MSEPSERDERSVSSGHRNGLHLDHFTLRDESLEHQVVIFSEPGNGHIHVSCNCLAKRGTAGPWSQGHQSMGVVRNLEDSRALYNDPANHRKPFGPEDVAKW